MEARTNEDFQAVKQLPKLKSLLNKYRQLKTMQTSLLQLSELASTVTEMAGFYSALEKVISTLLITDHFHIALLNTSGDLKTAYCHNPQEERLFDYLDQQHWHQSLTGIVFDECEPIHCNSAERLALAKAGKIIVYNSSCEDWLGVPLSRGNQVIGVIALQSYDQKIFFDDKDSQLLQFIAEHLVTAIDRVRSRELLELNIRQRTQKLTETNKKLQKEIADRQKAEKMHKALLRIAEITVADQGLDAFYQAIHQEVATLLQADNFYICLIANDNDELTFPYSRDESISLLQKRTFSNGLTEHVIKKGKPVLIANNEITTLSKKEIYVEAISHIKVKGNMPKAWLAAPLKENDEVVGVLAIQHYHDDKAYQSSDLELIKFISQHVSIAITRMRSQEKVLQSNEQLEILVNERTQALQASNLNLRMQMEERRKAEEQLYFEAHHDALTKLPNRAMFLDRLSYTLRHMKRHINHRFAVLFIDLDRFKMINDTLGHLAGDQFLIEIAARLTQCVRDNDILARLGGDEFVILLDSFQSQEDVEEVSSRIISAVEKPFELDGHTLYSNASIGIALCGQHYQEANEILRDADAAMYQAKHLGRGRYVFFDDSMREQLIASMTLEQELRMAVHERQFELHYQKISDLENTTTLGFEALLRWNHPKKGVLTPSEFLFMAEETGLIIEIENWVLEEVALQLSHWQASVEFKHAFISINLSGRQLTQVNQVANLIQLIKQNDIEPHRLIIEFNESSFSNNSELALKGLKKLKDFGVKLALDDYGAGLSSLNLIHNYPFEFIKLDRQFIKTLDHNTKNISLVKALNEMGAHFGYRLVAEGIESKDMLEKLKSVGCEFGQGYYISRPCKIENTAQELPAIQTPFRA